MKKIISLVMAILMLATLAIGISAATPVTSANLGDLLYQLYGSYNTTRISDLTSWFEPCPDCGGDAIHYFADGGIRWQCIATGCRHSGKIELGTKDKFVSADSWYYGACPTCGKTGCCLYLGSSMSNGKLYDDIYCINCRANKQVENKTFSLEGIPAEIPCTHDDCKKTAKFTGLVLIDNIVYAKYVCPDKHDSQKIVSGQTGYFKDFIVSVRCPDTGTFTMTGSPFATYGEEKTFEFKAKAGYVLTDVLVNGVSYGAKNTFKIVVKSNLVINPVFEKTANLKEYTITLKTKGLGSIVARKNGTVVTADTVKAHYTDKVTYTFAPQGQNYSIGEVLIDGKSAGRTTDYTFTEIQRDHTIEVVFNWKNPYVDVIDKYLAAVEYVTETGVLGPVKEEEKGLYFGGTLKITKEQVAVAFAELADTADLLTTDADRLAWAKKNGFVGETDDLSAVCDVQSICGMVKAFLLSVAKENNVTFKGVSAADDLRDTSIGIGLVAGKTFDTNREVTRYDLAAVCKLITRLSFTE